MRVQPLESHGAQRAAFADALAAADLPVEDLDLGGRYFALEVEGEAVAFGGLEGEGPDQLLRSVVVAPSRRGEGLGARMVEALAASADGAERLWLLTTTAERFFAGLGWQAVDRAEAPPAIAASREFAALCPASAVLMRRTRQAAPT